jgi:hypothetical protein
MGGLYTTTISKKNNLFTGILSHADFNYCSNFILNKVALLPLWVTHFNLRRCLVFNQQRMWRNKILNGN